MKHKRKLNWAYVAQELGVSEDLLLALESNGFIETDMSIATIRLIISRSELAAQWYEKPQIDDEPVIPPELPPLRKMR